VLRRCIVQYNDLRQKKTLYADEQDTPRVIELRHDYRRWLDKIDVQNLVFVDEAGLNQ